MKKSLFVLLALCGVVTVITFLVLTFITTNITIGERVGLGALSILQGVMFWVFLKTEFELGWD